MAKRRYTSYLDVYGRLETFCAEKLRAGESVLPSERNLAKMFGASLMTTRKAVEEALNNGIIIRSGRHTGIRENRCLARLGRIVFVTGNSDQVMLPAMERMWLMLKPEIEKLGGSAEFFIDTPDTHAEEFISRIGDADTVLLTFFASEGDILKRKLESLLPFRNAGRLLLLSHQYSERFDNVICLDERAVGEVAAEALNRAGCTKALVLGVLESSQGFGLRLEGFRETFRGEVINHPRRTLSFLTDFIGEEIRRLNQAVAEGTDGVFIATDEWTPRLTAGIMARHLVPEKLKIVTVHGSGECCQCILPLANVSHSTAVIVAQALETLKRISTDPPAKRVRILVRPSLHMGKTLSAGGTAAKVCCSDCASPETGMQICSRQQKKESFT